MNCFNSVFIKTFLILLYLLTANVGHSREFTKADTLIQQSKIVKVLDKFTNFSKDPSSDSQRKERKEALLRYLPNNGLSEAFNNKILGLLVDCILESKDRDYSLTALNLIVDINVDSSYGSLLHIFKNTYKTELHWSNLWVPIAKTKHKEAYEFLIEQFNTKSRQRYDLIDALAVLGDRRATKHLIDYYNQNIESWREKDRLYMVGKVAKAIGKLADPDAYDFLNNLCKDRKKEYFPDAIWALSQLKDKRSEKLFLKNLKNDESYVRRSSARGLGYIRSVAAIKPLLKKVKKNKYDGAKYAYAEALVMIDTTLALNTFYEILEKSKKYEYPINLAQGVESINHQDVLEFLLFAHNKVQNPHNIEKMLYNFDSTLVIPRFLKELDNPGLATSLKIIMLDILLKYKDIAIQKKMRELLCDQQPRLPYLTISRYLCDLKDSSSVSCMGKLLVEKYNSKYEYYDRNKLINMISEFQIPESVPFLFKSMNMHKSLEPSVQAIRNINGAIPKVYLMEALTDWNPPVRALAAELIRNYNDLEVNSQLEKMLSDNSILVQKEVAKTMVFFENENVIKNLQTNFSADDDSIKKKIAIYALTNESALPYFHKKISEAPVPTQIDIIRILADIGHEKSIEFLTPFLDDTSSNIANEAKTSLKKIVDEKLMYERYVASPSLSHAKNYFQLFALGKHRKNILENISKFDQKGYRKLLNDYIFFGSNINSGQANDPYLYDIIKLLKKDKFHKLTDANISLSFNITINDITPYFQEKLAKTHFKSISKCSGIPIHLTNSKTSARYLLLVHIPDYQGMCEIDKMMKPAGGHNDHIQVWRNYELKCKYILTLIDIKNNSVIYTKVHYPKFHKDSSSTYDYIENQRAERFQDTVRKLTFSEQRMFKEVREINQNIREEAYNDVKEQITHIICSELLNK